MAVRNFWVESDIDGRETELSGGPRAKDGGMTVKISQRENGSIKADSVVIKGIADGDALSAVIYVDGAFCGRFNTKR